LISASTCAAAAPHWAPPVPPDAGEEAAEAGAEAWELAAPVAGAVWRGSGESECDGPVLVGCARAMAWRGGTVTTAGGTATARPAWLAAQRAVPAEPQPATVVRELTTPPDAGPAEKTPRAR
jgi:hypothetical protein